jgi:hypothetical protein
VRRKIAAEGQVDSEETDALVTGEEMPSMCLDEAGAARGFVEPRADIGNGCAGIVPWQDERE